MKTFGIIFLFIFTIGYVIFLLRITNRRPKNNKEILREINGE